MKFKVKDLSKCIGKSVTLPVAMEKFSNKILDFEPDIYHRVGIFMYDDWYFESEWLEPVEESAPTQENSTESGPKEKLFKDITPDTKVSIPEGWPETPAERISILAGLKESGPNNDKLVLTADFSDPVSNPSHYKFSDFEPIKVIQAWDLSFALGNVVKYIARAGRKDSSKLIEDLEKARKYLDFELEFLRQSNTKV